MQTTCPAEILNTRPTLISEKSTTELKTLSYLLAKHFISRKDVKAIQRTNPLGAYNPTVKRNVDGEILEYYGWDYKSLAEHLTGKKTYGHYLLDKDATCKIFCFDIDLKKLGKVPTVPLPSDENGVEEWLNSFQEVNLRDTWVDRRHPSREWLKISMRSMAMKLSSACSEYDVPTITSYTGSKGLHVYGLIGRGPAKDAYDAAHLIVDSIPNLTPHKGEVFFEWDDPTDLENSIFTIETFPKQVMTNDDGFGNLLRAPYGINLKSPRDRTFFIDETLPLGQIAPASFEQIFSALEK